MNTYRSLRDLPGAPKGTVINRKVDSMHYRVGPVLYSEFDIKMLPDWFEIVQPESLEEAVGKFFELTKDLNLYATDTHGWHKFCEGHKNLRTVFNRIKQEGK